MSSMDYQTISFPLIRLQASVKGNARYLTTVFQGCAVHPFARFRWTDSFAPYKKRVNDGYLRITNSEWFGEIALNIAWYSADSVSIALHGRYAAHTLCSTIVLLSFSFIKSRLRTWCKIGNCENNYRNFTGKWKMGENINYEQLEDASWEAHRSSNKGITWLLLWAGNRASFNPASFPRFPGTRLKVTYV